MAINHSRSFRLEPSFYDPEGLIGFTVISVTNYADTNSDYKNSLPLLPKEFLPLVYGDSNVG